MLYALVLGGFVVGFGTAVGMAYIYVRTQIADHADRP